MRYIASEASGSSAAIRVILVDDDPLTLELHRAHVQRVGGFSVVAECRDARSAARTVTDPTLAADLVLLDVTMPDGTGLEVLRHARARGVRTDVIAVSGVRDVDVVREMVALGAVQYLIKPYTFAMFRERIEAFREYHRRSHQTTGDATQHEVDAMLASLRTAPVSTLPKGIAAATLESVTRVVRDHGPSTASEVAAGLGISREVSRRYLEFLADADRLVRDPRYGARGRPQVEYRWHDRATPSGSV